MKFLHFKNDFPLELIQIKSNKELLAFVFNDFLMFTTVNKPLASINLQFLFDKKSSVTLKMYRKVNHIFCLVKDNESHLIFFPFCREAYISQRDDSGARG